MDATDKNVETKSTKMAYQPPAMKKHEPIKIVQGSWDDCGYLYYVSLYYY
jgi:hypothetical protein